jgi:DNA (cytosine-5)-methyltransferase 1
LETFITRTLCNNGKAAGSATSQDAENGFLVPIIAGTMKSCASGGGQSNSADHAAAGYMIPVAFDINQAANLTPRECERLQGFPDDYTLVPNRGKPAADGPRYKALGNSMAVPVMRWIGERIAKMEALS